MIKIEKIIELELKVRQAQQVHREFKAYKVQSVLMEHKVLQVLT
jgi:hypothetical protein